MARAVFPSCNVMFVSFNNHYCSEASGKSCLLVPPSPETSSRPSNPPSPPPPPAAPSSPPNNPHSPPPPPPAAPSSPHNNPPSPPPPRAAPSSPHNNPPSPPPPPAAPSSPHKNPPSPPPPRAAPSSPHNNPPSPPPPRAAPSSPHNNPPSPPPPRAAPSSPHNNPPSPPPPPAAPSSPHNNPPSPPPPPPAAPSPSSPPNNPPSPPPPPPAAPSPSSPPSPPTILPPPPNTTSVDAGSGNSSSKLIIATVIPAIGIILLFISIFYFLRVRNVKKRSTIVQTTDVTTVSVEESTQYDFATIQAITNDFSPENKIGEGGYGSVYQGMLPTGQKAAVKRLSRSSRQGAQEFKNEVEVVAKLQHKNLVRLLGFCSKEEEKILIYEFVSNRSLDYFLFDPEKQYLLEWSRRYKIIRGIARGLLYLHEDSRLKIIHRDLKASNILLDANMDPKIADFGIARIFGVDQTQGSTNRIVGTYGYMSPEYAMHGEFSVKSDVFSFGVILLEIITGKKNRNFGQTNRQQDLLSYAWEQWRDGTPLEILDPVISKSYIVNEVIQCIHIGLLCVQEDAYERPTMTEVMMLMLNTHSINSWSAPREPAFYCSGSKRMLREKELEQSDDL